MLVAFARWAFTLVGGLLLGAGLVLHGQVALARMARHEVANTFVLWRALGQATFAFQTGDHRFALAMAELPREVIDESDRAAWVLVGVGVLFALTGPLLRGGQKPSAHRKPAR